MTEEEFIQQVTLFGPDDLAAYMVAFRSKNPTITSAIEELLTRMNASPDWSVCDYKEIWIFLPWLYELRDPKTTHAAEITLMISRLCEGERITAVSEYIMLHLRECWNDDMLHDLYSSTKSRPLLESLRRFLCHIADNAIVS